MTVANRIHAYLNPRGPYGGYKRFFWDSPMPRDRQIALGGVRRYALRQYLATR